MIGCREQFLKILLSKRGGEMKRRLLLWYYRHIKLKKLYKEEARILRVMQDLVYQSAYPRSFL